MARWRLFWSVSLQRCGLLLCVAGSTAVVGCLDPLVEDPGVNHETVDWKDPGGNSVPPIPGVGASPGAATGPSSTSAPTQDPANGGGAEPLNPPAGGGGSSGEVPSGTAVAPSGGAAVPPQTATPDAVDPGADFPPTESPGPAEEWADAGLPAETEPASPVGVDAGSDSEFEAQHAPESEFSSELGYQPEDGGLEAGGVLRVTAREAELIDGGRSSEGER